MGRKPQNRDHIHARVAADTSEELKRLALTLGYIYNGEGSIGGLLDAIASGELQLITKESLKKIKKGIDTQ